MKITHAVDQSIWVHAGHRFIDSAEYHPKDTQLAGRVTGGNVLAKQARLPMRGFPSVSPGKRTIRCGDASFPSLVGLSHGSRSPPVRGRVSTHSFTPTWCLHNYLAADTTNRFQHCYITKLFIVALRTRALLFVRRGKDRYPGEKTHVLPPVTLYQSSVG